MPGPTKLLVASSNPGKLREYAALARHPSTALRASGGQAAGHLFVLEPVPGFAGLPPFDESAPTFAENAAGKALHYSRFATAPVIADDSGLVVPALSGAPGPHSARYAGPNATDAERVRKLLEELRGKPTADRRARFVCALALAQAGRLVALFTDFVEGVLLEAPRGAGGFGYDPIFLYEPLGKTFAELTREEKNQLSHRGRAFRKLLAFLQGAS